MHMPGSVLMVIVTNYQLNIFHFLTCIKGISKIIMNHSMNYDSCDNAILDQSQYVETL
jgi:hypothetical protein